MKPIEISNQITSIHLKNRFLLKFNNSKSKQIINLFNEAFNTSPDTLELVKHLIDHEETDFLDLADLLNDLNKRDRETLFNLFNHASKYISPHLQLKIISDLDNTAIENSLVAPLPQNAINGNPVHHFVPLVNKLTRNGQTSITFITARPKQFENQTIISVREKFKNEGLLNFAFESGDVLSPIELGISYAINSKRLMFNTFKKLAITKLECYKKLRKIYPSSRFVFFGDDTQGDYIFAFWFVKMSSLNIAFIRRIAQESTGIHPHHDGIWDNKISSKLEASSHPRIVYHQSYEYVESLASTSFSLL